MEADRKAKLGQRWQCFKCSTRFYDMNKPQPICPKCQADQHESPEFQKPAKKRGTKKAAAAPRKEAVLPVEDELEGARSGRDEDVEEEYSSAGDEAEFDDLDDLEIEDPAGGEDENVSVEVEDD